MIRSVDKMINVLAHRRLDTTNHHSEIPILAIPNEIGSSNIFKTVPYGKAVTIKTEEYPLSRPSIHDTNLSNAKLIITRDTEGRHRIEQITYKSEEDLLNPPLSCPHHSSSSPVPKVKSARGTGRLLPPSFDQDYSSVSSSIPRQSKEFISHSRPTSMIQKTNSSGFTECVINNIDDYISPHFASTDHDFDLSDINDALNTHPSSTIHQHDHDDDDDDDDDTTRMDEDSLESCQGTIDESKSMLPPSPLLSNRSLMASKSKLGGYCTALYLTQKKKQTLACTRSNTLSNVNEGMTHDQSIVNRCSSPRKTYLDPLDRMGYHDISKLDRDSGFDEQDFRCERLYSGGEEDNSSLSSIRSSLAHSTSSDIHQQSYRENKAYELRLKALDYSRLFHEQSSQDFYSNSRRNFNYASTRPTNEINPQINHKFRKHHHHHFQS